MKNKILCFIYAIIFVLPFVFLVSGCNTPPPPNNDGGASPPAPLTLTDVLNAFEKKSLPTNFTLTGNSGSTTNLFLYENNNIVDNSKLSNLSEGISLKYNNQDYSFLYPGENAQETYSIGGLTYKKVNPTNYSDNLFDLNYGREKNSLADFLTTKDTLNSVVTISNFFTRNSVTVEEKNNQIILNSNFSLKQTLSGLLDIVKKDLNKKLNFAITDILNTLFASNINFLDCVNEFKNGFTNTTTINDFVIFLSNKVGKDTSPVLEILYNLVSNFMPPLTTTNQITLINKNPNVSLGKVDSSIFDLSYNEIKTLKIVDLISVNEGENAKDKIFGKITNYLDNEIYTLKYCLIKVANKLNKNISSILDNISNFSISDGAVNIQITMDTTYNILGLKADITVGVLDLDTNQNGNKYLHFRECDFVVSGYNSTTVSLPKNININSVNYNINISSDEILELSQNYTKTCGDLQNIPSFEYKVELWNTQTQSYNPSQVFASYNSGLKQITLNHEILKQINLSEADYIKISDTNFVINIYITQN